MIIRMIQIGAQASGGDHVPISLWLRQIKK
jgi:hypothetical protein